MTSIRSHYIHIPRNNESILRSNDDNLRIFFDPARNYDETADPADAVKIGAIKAVKLG
jgi:hypothetical protein